MKEYDQIFEWYKAARSSSVGVEVVRNLFVGLPQGSTIVDYGCGTGRPLTAVLLEMGFKVIGVDSSQKMIASYGKSFPEAAAYQMPIQEFPIKDHQVTGVVCWGCLFHLTPNQQQQVLASIFSSIGQGGLLLFTSALEAGETTGEMDEVRFSYHSLGSDAYKQIANGYGWKLLFESYDEYDNYLYAFRH